MSRKIKIILLSIVLVIISILIISVIIINSREKLNKESTYTIVMDGQTTTVEKELTKEDYDMAQKILKEKAMKGNTSEIALMEENQSESVKRAIEELETIHKLLSSKTEKQDTNSIEEGIPQMPKSIIEEEEKKKKDLETIAKKYNKLDQFNDIMTKLEKQENISEFTNERIQMCELFIDIYNNNKLHEQEKNFIKDFLEEVSFEDVPNSLQNKIDEIVN